MTSLSAGNWIPWIAKEAKIYEKHGLDVELILLRGSGQTSSAMLGGSIFASPVALPTVMLAKPEIRNRKPEESSTQVSSPSWIKAAPSENSMKQDRREALGASRSLFG